MLQPGQIIQDKYRIVRLIGQGGMGEVYEGENVAIARRVAIKVLLGEAATSADIVQRFEREAQAAGRIGNDHILEVLDLGTLDTGDRFMVMEYLDGEPLNGRIQRLVRLTPRQSVPLMVQALAGLAAAHHAGIIHRDLKPENIYVLKQKAGVLDFVKIIDFGISKFNQLTTEGMKMTRTGSVMGTPYYMSPEQANGSREADARSDLYAMGVILYECVTGAVPFDGKTFNELLFKIVLSDPPSPRALAPDLDPAFEAIILKAMAREVSARYQTCEEFSQVLREYQALRGTPLPDATGSMPAFAAAQAQAHAAMSGPSTGANWSKSETSAPIIPKRSNAGIVAALLGVALLVVGGGAFAAYKMLHGSAPSAASSTESALALSKPAEKPAPPVSAAELQSAPPSVQPVGSAAASSPAVSVTPSKPLVPGKALAPAAHPAAAAHAPPPGKKPAAGAKPGGGSTDFGY